MAEWHFIPKGRPEDDDIPCPFCKKYMKCDGVRCPTENDPFQENNWICVNPTCFHRSLITITFKV